MPDRVYYRWLLLITVVAWGIRLGVTERFIGLSSPIDPADGMDESDYELFAYQMSAGRGYVLEDGTPSARRAPGTSLLILPVYILFGRSLFAARLWITLLSALTCAAAAWVARPRGGPVIGLLTAAFLAVDPGALYYALHLWSEAPFSLALTLAVGCVLRAVETKSRGRTLLAGLAWTAALVLRSQIAFLAPCLLLAGCWLKPSERQRWFRELLREGLIVVALISPWLIRNWVMMGSPTLVTIVGGQTFWGAHNGRTFQEASYRGGWRPYELDPGVTFPITGSELEQDRQAWSNGWQCLRLYWKEIPAQECWKVYRLITPFESTPNRSVYWSFAAAWIVSFPFVVIGLRRWKEIDAPLYWWMVLNFAAVLLSALLFYGASRFRHSVEPFLMMAAAAGVISLTGCIRRTTAETPLQPS